MSRAYPIWNDITACIYNSSKSYGVKSEGIVNIKVGTSKTYSYDFVKHRTTKRDLNKDVIEYRFFVDDMLVKRSQFNKKTKVYSHNLPITNHEKIMGKDAV
tara:strand:- start:4102 stop:4404 length:303 start_codon:yes stop_codon:yes gene_type:complete